MIEPGGVKAHVEVTAKLGGDDSSGMGVEAGNAEIDMPGVVENPDLGMLGGRDAILGFALAEAGDRSGPLPCRVGESAVDAGGVVDVYSVEVGRGLGAASAGNSRRRYLTLNTRTLKG